MTIDIKRFCVQKDDAREWLRQPWIENGNTIATNGHVALVLLGTIASDANAEPYPGMRGAVQRLIDKTAANRLRTAIGAVDLVKTDCPYCSGAGFVSCTKCSACGGAGELQDNQGWSICESCEGDGILTVARQPTDKDAQPCYSCCGTGHDRNSATAVGNVHLANRYLAMLQHLPNCVLIVPDDDKDDVRIEFDGGVGVIATIRQ